MKLNSAEQSFIVPDLGEIKIKRVRGQKTTTLRVSRKGEVVVRTNQSTPLYSLRGFVLTHREWIKQSKEKSGLNEKIEIYDGQLICDSLRFKLAINVDPTAEDMRFVYRKGQNEIKIFVNNPTDYVELDSQSRQDLEKVVIKALRAKAQEVLLPRLKELSHLTSKSYSSATIRNTSSRWGSCSGKNDISLSLWLMLTPKELQDYVMVHELAHTVYKDHGELFWREVSKWVPNHKELRSKLKRYAAQVWW